LGVSCHRRSRLRRGILHRLRIQEPHAGGADGSDVRRRVSPLLRRLRAPRRSGLWAEGRVGRTLRSEKSGLAQPRSPSLRRPIGPSNNLRVSRTAMNVVDPILFQCKLNPLATAICVPGAPVESVTYGMLEKCIYNVERNASKEGIAPRSVVSSATPQR